jgi:hypothetical protein
MYFDSSVRAEHYADLADKLAAIIAGPFKAQLGLLAAQQLASFDKDFKLALVESPNRFSAAAQKAAADAVVGFDEGANDVLVAGTELSGEWRIVQTWAAHMVCICVTPGVSTACWLRVVMDSAGVSWHLTTDTSVV